jgi:putative Holliday junction resolvase
VRTLAALVEEHGVTDIVVGHPLRMAGGAGEAADQAETFARTLEQYLSVRVHLQDERLTTVQAHRELARAGLRGKDRRAVVDESAATLILQAFLDRTAPSTSTSS